jgi:hypothetical protein
MARIFRRLRAGLLHEARSREYLLYAAGELVLVIVGIKVFLVIEIKRIPAAPTTRTLVIDRVPVGPWAFAVDHQSASQTTGGAVGVGIGNGTAAVHTLLHGSSFGE